MPGRFQHGDGGTETETEVDAGAPQLCDCNQVQPSMVKEDATVYNAHHRSQHVQDGIFLQTFLCFHVTNIDNSNT